MLNLKLYITQDLEVGGLVRIDEVTGLYTPENTGGYGFPNTDISAITAVRFLTTNFIRQQNASSSVTQCLSGVEYEVVGSGANTISVATKTFSLGDKFVLMQDATPTIGAGLSLIETGFFAYVPQWTPQSYYLEFNPSLFGINDLVFPDSVYSLRYEVYKNVIPAGSAPAGKYIVLGTSGSTAISGEIHLAGEVFEQTSTFTFTGNNIALFEAEDDFIFPLYFHAFKTRNEVANQFVKKDCKCKDKWGYKLFKIDSRLEAIKYAFTEGLGVDFSGTQTMLEEIQQIKKEIINC